MRLKTGDNVKIIAGKDKGKTGKIVQAFPDLGKVVVEGLNLMHKHMKVRKQGEKGQRIEYSSPLNATNVQLICPKCAKPTRVGAKTLGAEAADTKVKKVRICKKCREAIE